jgi:hypothetical protein
MMKRPWTLTLLVFTSCGSPDTETMEECGTTRGCPVGFTCDEITRRCVRLSTDVPDAAPDAPPPDAAAAAPDAPPVPPPLTITPLRRDFGSLPVGGASSPFTFTVRNASAARVGPLTASTADASYRVAGGTCGGASIDAGATCTVIVRFHPAGEPGTKLSTLTVGAGADSVSAMLSGVALRPATIELDVGMRAFGRQAVGTASAEATLTVRNTGQAPSAPLAVTLGDGDHFTISSGGCAGPLAAGGSCVVGVRFRPAAVGLHQDELRVADGAGGLRVAGLEGTGTAELTVLLGGAGGGTVTSAPAAIDCGATCVAELDVPTVTLTATPDAQSSFVTWSGGGCSGTAPCVVELDAALTVTALFSELMAALALAPESHYFGSLLVGEVSPEVTYTLTNGGAAPSGELYVTPSDPQSWAVIGGTCPGAEIGAGESCTVVVQFAPAGSSGHKLSELIVMSSTGAIVTAILEGVALSEAELTLSPGLQSFGAVDITSGGTEASFTLRNGGQTVSGAVTATLSPAGDFVISSNGCTGTLRPQGSCTIGVRFAPSTVGSKSAELTASAEPGGEAAATLQGTGVATLTVQKNGTGSGGVTSTPAGIDCGGLCSASFSTASVSLTAAPDVTSTFAGWSGACAGTGGCAVTMSTAQTVIATFTLRPAALSISPTSAAFGHLILGQMTGPSTFTVTNDGWEASGAIGASTTDPASFVVTGGTCLSQTLAGGGATCTVDVIFDPTTPGEKSASLIVTASPGGSPGATLTGSSECQQYGEECSATMLCCDQVPCTGSRCRYP